MTAEEFFKNLKDKLDASMPDDPDYNSDEIEKIAEKRSHFKDPVDLALTIDLGAEIYKESEAVITFESGERFRICITRLANREDTV
jgi:hypothetical protein